MADVYKALHEGRAPNLAGPAAPGMTVIANIVGVHDFDSLFTSFCNYFHIPGNWTWNGGAGTPSSQSILDGDAKTGQCVALARALRMLAEAAPPYGLGLAGVGDPYVQGRYTGQTAQGFISDHPGNPGVLGLRANIFTIGDIRFCPRGQLYAWDDHKVVPYNGRFYDPSYRHVLNTLPEMAAYQVTGEVRRNHILGRPPAEVWTFYLATHAVNGTQVYFRCLTPAETLSRATSPGAAQGPYPGNNPAGTPC